MESTRCAAPTVRIVDSDESLCRVLAGVLNLAGHRTITYPAAEQLLESVDESHHGCIVLDLLMPKIPGLEVMSRLKDRGVRLPIVFISGTSDVPSAITALRDGAIHLLQKPVSPIHLVEAVNLALSVDAERRRAFRALDDIRRRISVLSECEREILACVAHGLTTRDIANRFDLPKRTVESYRSKTMRKTGANSIAELVRLHFSMHPDEVHGRSPAFLRSSSALLRAQRRRGRPGNDQPNRPDTASNT